jgi:hypothetical protein
MEEVKAIIEIINAGGVLALLVLFTWAFYDGKIISKKTLDHILSQYQTQTEQMFQDLLKEIKRSRGW